MASEPLYVVAHESVLIVTVSAVTSPDIGIIKEVPHFVFHIEVGESCAQCLLGRVAYSVPLFHIIRGGERQCHQALQFVR